MRRTAVAIAVFFALTLTVQAHAQWAVFDATNFANAVREFNQVEQLYTTANQTRDQIIQTYNLAWQMARMPQNLYQRYSAEFARWKAITAPNTYGNTGAWISAVNTGNPLTASTGYAAAGVSLLQNLPSQLGKLDPRSQDLVKSQVATAELADGTSVNALATLGEIRARSEALDRQISNLETDSYSTNPSQQTEMSVLGKINSATVMQLRSQQDTNQLLSAAALHQLLASKEQFDQQKRALNQAIYFNQNFKDSIGRMTSGMTQSMQSVSFSARLQ